MNVDGALCAAVIDIHSGMIVSQAGDGSFVEAAASDNSKVIQMKIRTMKSLNLNDFIDDILITLKSQYHLLRPIAQAEESFLYFILDRSESNLALARIKLKEIEDSIEVEDPIEVG